MDVPQRRLLLLAARDPGTAPSAFANGTPASSQRVSRYPVLSLLRRSAEGVFLTP